VAARAVPDGPVEQSERVSTIGHTFSNPEGSVAPGRDVIGTDTSGAVESAPGYQPPIVFGEVTGSEDSNFGWISF